ncbi:MAG: ubiquitin-like protein Pup [Candidatus Nanopelagicales bacterium]|nr:ubiquitin-like protein Pup [Candidatus Nanopelagicales bacterium]
MSQREPVQARRPAREEPAEQAGAPTASATDTDVDAILDEIDSVLEANAEDFVKSFVQKGGQ